jgi:hypothetical protein
MRHDSQEIRTLLLEQIIEATPTPHNISEQPGLTRGLVIGLLESGEIEVVVPSVSEVPIRCDFLETAQNASLQIQPGDLVLVLHPESPGENGCVLGRVGRYRSQEAEPATRPDHLVIEAGESLTIKCGESSVDLRKDGKVMIRGSDVLSRAKRTNRIKGGSVAIN